jgi:hypothetical protein
MLYIPNLLENGLKNKKKPLPGNPDRGCYFRFFGNMLHYQDYKSLTITFAVNDSDSVFHGQIKYLFGNRMSNHYYRTFYLTCVIGVVAL